MTSRHSIPPLALGVALAAGLFSPALSAGMAAPQQGQRVLADGLIIESPKARLFALQFVMPLPDG